ncbi:MAG: hypothetical protein B7733_20505 [Myxococcales bacterium FL481]|nr:MAG: hypothetical protein B7733_20505 [Myxococcales bacterium FL481]
MHLAEGMLPLNQALGWSAAAAPAVIWSIRGELRARPEDAVSPAMRAGVTTLLFAATLLPIPVPVVGATAHLCLTPVLALVFGVRRIIWPTFFVVLIQAVFFAHGGLTTLGANTLTLGLVGPLATLGLWNLTRRVGVGEGVGVALACGAGALSISIADAAVLALALSEVTAPSTTFVGVLLGFAPIQVPVAIVEAMVSIGLVRLLATRRADLVPEPLRTLRKRSGSGALAVVFSLAVGLSACRDARNDPAVLGTIPATPAVDLSACRGERVDTAVLRVPASPATRSPMARNLDRIQLDSGIVAPGVRLRRLG